MRSVCLYSSYFEKPVIPYYIRFYLENLQPHFSELIFLTNEKVLNEESIAYLKHKNIKLMYVKNEGWDFGMWHKGLKQIDVKAYDRIGLINDSCVLFTSAQPFFDWLDINELDYCGMLDSNAIAYHIQSYFIVINKNAIATVVDYFTKHGVINDLKKTIQTYEIGLSQHMINKGFKVGALHSTKLYNGEFSPTYFMPEELIRNGLPLIKKKIVSCSFRDDEQLNLMRMKYKMDPRYYINLIRVKYKDDPTLIDLKQIEPKRNLNFHWCMFKYNFRFFFFQIFRKFKFLKPA